MNLLINGRIYSNCCCNTSATSYNMSDGTTDTSYNGCPYGHPGCPYCTNTATGETKEEIEEIYRKSVEREDLQLEELGRIDRSIKRKVNLPIIPQNVINKSMNRRMMNGRH
jgi:hypothetical protein